MSDTPVRPNKPRLPGWLVLAVIVCIGAVAVVAMVWQQLESRTQRRLADRQAALEALLEEVSSQMAATEELIAVEALRLMQQEHPELKDWAKPAGSIELVLLRSSDPATPDAHGALLLNPSRGQGWLKTRSLPALPGDGLYHVTVFRDGRRERLGEVQDGVPARFDVPPRADLRSFEVNRSSATNPIGSPILQAAIGHAPAVTD